MENFIVSARKYRPDTFSSVVGQSSITTTLKNAIKVNQIAHAYLFCGPRGIGKTTCARIFAKTVNCMNPDDNLEACNKCESCKSFNESRAYNIHELDAASNNSVDDIRNLIEQVRIPPQVGKYSIYIVDEVHMLSASAFNAFLKTLEEPPSHAIYILATTEKHKIIPTILSRCQIYDFNRIKVEDIVKYLEFISKKEGIEYETDAFNIIAQKADGAMRDALSIYDQLVNLLNKNITHKGVIESLNVLDYDYYFNLTDAFLNSDVSKAMLIFNDILNSGFDGHNFINGLSNHLRDLLVCKDKQTIQLLEAGSAVKQKYSEYTTKCSSEFIFKALEICSACDTGYRISKNQRLHVELALLKLCNIIDEKKNKLKVQEDKHEEKTEDKKAVTEKEDKKTDTEKEEKKEQIKADSAESETADIQEKKQEKIISPPRFKSSISIKEALKDAEKLADKQNSLEKPENDVPEAPEEKNNDIAISSEKLEGLWKEFTESIKDSMPRMYSTLSGQKPSLNKNGNVELELSNNAQFDDFNQKIKSELVSFLREKSGNDSINIEVHVPGDAEDNQKPYTSDEKFKYLSRKNPLLNKLKQEFNLDFE
ncbi:MAG: DNA polymerase III subunit gamma/tau [Bacteroidales bacterium]|nr:MAG: DNA polymerase III subunit gamma/tau [Bacteroidales bacterium]